MVSLTRYVACLAVLIVLAGCVPAALPTARPIQPTVTAAPGGASATVVQTPVASPTGASAPTATAQPGRQATVSPVAAAGSTPPAALSSSVTANPAATPVPSATASSGATASGTAPPPTQGTALPTALTLPSNAGHDQIRRMLLRSTSNWLTLWADASLTVPSLAAQGAPAGRAQLWLRQPCEARFLAGAANAAPETISVADGQQLVTRMLMTPSQSSLPLAKSGECRTPAIEGQAAAHPLLALGSPLVFAALPSGWVARDGVFSGGPIESVAGRPAERVEWKPPAGPCMGCAPSRLWIDVETGVVLRWQELDGDKVASEMVVNAIHYDIGIPQPYFDPMPVLAEAYSDDFAGVGQPPLALIEPAAGATTGVSPLFRWRAVPGAVRYRILVIDAGTTRALIDQVIGDADLAAPAPLPAGRTYDCVVNALDAASKPVASGTVRFTVK